MAILLFLGMLMCFALSAAATQTGSIRIETTGGTVALYQVGQINGQSVLLTEQYGGGVVTQADILSANLAAWLYERSTNGYIKDTDISGNTQFDGLSAGLYLVAQPSTPSGQYPFEPFLITLPWDGYVWDVTIDLEQMPQTGYPDMPDMWIAALLISALGIGICWLLRKKRIV